MSQYIFEQREQPVVISGSSTVVPIIIQKSMTILDSSAVPLAAAGVYTSPSFDVSEYGEVCGSVFSDQSGVLNIEFSADNINFDAAESTPYLASSQLGYNVNRFSGIYARARYVNGAVPQATFRIWLIGRK
jgi:hypothetical protein